MSFQTERLGEKEKQAARDALNDLRDFRGKHDRKLWLLISDDYVIDGTTIWSVPELTSTLSIHAVGEVPRQTVHRTVERLAAAGENALSWGVLETYTEHGHKKVELTPLGQKLVERQAWVISDPMFEQVFGEPDLEGSVPV